MSSANDNLPAKLVTLFPQFKKKIAEMYQSFNMKVPDIKILEVNKNMIYCVLKYPSAEYPLIDLYMVMNHKQRAEISSKFQKKYEAFLSDFCKQHNLPAYHIFTLPHQFVDNSYLRKQIGIMFDCPCYKETRFENEIKLSLSKNIKDLLGRGVSKMRIYHFKKSNSTICYFEGYLNDNEKNFIAAPSFDFSSLHEYYLQSFTTAVENITSVHKNDDFLINIRLNYQKNDGFFSINY